MADPHHAVGKSRAKLLHPDQSSAGFQPGIELLQVVLGQLVQRDLSQFRDDVFVDPVGVTLLCSGADLGLAVSLIPERHPLPEGHILPALADGRRAFLPQFVQLIQAFRPGFAQHIFRFWHAIIIVPDDNSSLPAPVFSFSQGSGTAFSFLSHGVTSHNLVQESTHNPRRFAVHIRGHVGVGIQREGRVGVSQNP